MAKSQGKIFRIYTKLKFKNSILGISTLVFSIKCVICLTNLHYFSVSLANKLDKIAKHAYNITSYYQ